MDINFKNAETFVNSKIITVPTEIFKRLSDLQMSGKIKSNKDFWEIYNTLECIGTTDGIKDEILEVIEQVNGTEHVTFLIEQLELLEKLVGEK